MKKTIIIVTLVAVLLVGVVSVSAYGQSNFCSSDDVLRIDYGSQRNFARCTDGDNIYNQLWRIICVGTFDIQNVAGGVYVSCSK